jgi:trans-aconitate 2-methyltransferase
LSGPKRTHDWDAKTYDRVSGPQLRWGTAVLDRLDLRGDERVLDAGCGTARVSELLLPRIPRGQLVALDADPAMIAEAQQRLAPFGERVQFLVANLLDPLRIEPVDAVFSTAALHWIRDHDRAFANLAGVLRLGGQLVVQCGGAGNVSGFLSVMAELGEAAGAPWYFATPADTEALLRRLGFDPVEVWLSDEPTRFETRDDMEAFVRTSCLGPWLANLPPEQHDSFSNLVAKRLPTLELDYVRLNIVARRAAAPHN